MKIIPPLLFLVILTACNNKLVTNTQNLGLKFSDIQSDYKVTDTNNYGCKKIDVQILKHILTTGTSITAREIHDYYDTTGCSIKGQLTKNDQIVSFTFDYGGIFYFGDETLFGCGKKCCEDNFIYCTYSENGLKGE